MRFFKIKKILNIFANLKFAIFLLLIIAISSSLGSLIEQDESILYYQEKYPKVKPIYGLIDSNFILNLGLDHIYRVWWFLFLLGLLGLCLASCTILRQFSLFLNSKEYFFKQKKISFINLPIFVKLKARHYLKETFLIFIKKINFYLYQNENCIYGYKGLIGRISPIFVHLSLISILIGCTFSALKNFKAQEILLKGEFFHVQNPLKIGALATLPVLNIRINDFWVQYEKNKIYQFYSNISLLDDYNKEIKQQTILVNNPLRFKGIDLYQSDWSLFGIRLKKEDNKKVYEYPLFLLNKKNKIWITWIKNINKNYSLIFDQLQNICLTYDQFGTFLSTNSIGDLMLENYSIMDILSSTGIFIKYDPSVNLIYLGFCFLILTTLFSYLPYSQLWIFKEPTYLLVGKNTNRGKVQAEIEFENLTRSIKKILK